ncbi:hypothetical protein BS162P3_00002 [Bacteroides phage BS162P3]|nr:hypothetical protein BS162P3_00002 [Bacteroides phage BS162P3]
MKKLVLLAMLVFTSVSMFSQITSQGKPEVLKSFRLGVCKLIDTDGALTIVAQTKESAGLKLTVDLGNYQEAETLIASMIEYTPKAGETVNLNNPSGNTAYYQKLNGTWVIESASGVASIAVSKGELKKMLEAITE